MRYAQGGKSAENKKRYGEKYSGMIIYIYNGCKKHPHRAVQTTYFKLQLERKEKYVFKLFLNSIHGNYEYKIKTHCAKNRR